MAKKHEKSVKTLSLRLPKQVAVALQKRAKAQKRSINGQIVHEIEVNGLPQTDRTESAAYFREANIALTGQP
jgi:hypothetical protein